MSWRTPYYLQETYVLISPRWRVVKIGRCFPGNEPSRVKAAQRALEDPRIEFVGYLDKSEWSCHQDLAEHRTAGEWFLITPAVRSYIRAHFSPTYVVRQNQ